MQTSQALYTSPVPCCLCPAEMVVDVESGEAFCVSCEPERLVPFLTVEIHHGL